MSTIKVTNIQNPSASDPSLAFETDGSLSSVVPGGATLYPHFASRAWVNFNGTGTVAIRDSGNVSSITDNGTGDYTVNFTTAMPDANYSAVALATIAINNGAFVFAPYTDAPSVSAFRLLTTDTTFTITDSEYASVTISR